MFHGHVRKSVPRAKPSSQNYISQDTAAGLTLPRPLRLNLLTIRKIGFSTFYVMPRAGGWSASPIGWCNAYHNHDILAGGDAFSSFPAGCHATALLCTPVAKLGPVESPPCFALDRPSQIASKSRHLL